MDYKYTIDDANSASIAYIAMDFLESGISLRKFAQENCSFSYVTLRDKLIKFLPSVNKELASEINDLLETRKPKPISDDYVAKKRVLSAITLIINESITIEEIAERLNSSVMTIYRDLTRRMIQMDEVDNETRKIVLLRLREHSLDNLNKRGK